MDWVLCSLGREAAVFVPSLLLDPSYKCIPATNNRQHAREKKKNQGYVFADTYAKFPIAKSTLEEERRDQHIHPPKINKKQTNQSRPDPGQSPNPEQGVKAKGVEEINDSLLAT